MNNPPTAREILPKIRAIRRRCKDVNPSLDIMVDGGINIETGAECAAEGANALVAGSALYRSKDMAGDIAEMRRRAEGAWQ